MLRNTGPERRAASGAALQEPWPSASGESAISPLPTHVAIIMDGNRRWAKQRHLPLLAGHRAGAENIHAIIQAFNDYGVKYLTIYAFSTENWSRPLKEVHGLFQILRRIIDRETKALHAAGVQVRHLGSLEDVPSNLRTSITRGIQLTRHNDKMVLSIAFNYGGRTEIVDAVQRIVRDSVAPEAIDSALISRYMYTTDLPDPDLIIRTAGEMRLSNFLIWQAAYAEYYSTATLWPDFDLEEIRAALLAYSHRKRRFGSRAEE